jgi:hypothetical protein
LTRVGLMQSQSAGRFMPRRSLVGSLASEPPPVAPDDRWPFLRV